MRCCGDLWWALTLIIRWDSSPQMIVSRCKKMNPNWRNLWQLHVTVLTRFMRSTLEGISSDPLWRLETIKIFTKYTVSGIPGFHLPGSPQFYPGLALVLPSFHPKWNRLFPSENQLRLRNKNDENWNLTKTIMIFWKNDLCIFTLKRITIVVIEYKLYNRDPSCNYN